MPGPLLRTARFELWQPQSGDLDGLVAMLADEETARFLGPARATHASQFERLQRNAGSWALYGYGTFAVRVPGSVGIIATGGVFHTWRGFAKGMDDVPEGGWIVRQDWWGKGVASEVMTAAMDWFDAAHGPRRITCMIETANLASVRLAAKLGFTAYDSHDMEDGAKLILYQRGDEQR
jgi:RimJ/RimL family protein N-acetyltransferase